jgi:HKD family nuclease
MGLINQPREGSVGSALSAVLENNDTTRESEFHIITAYAKKSGVQRLVDPIKQFRTKGGKAIGIVGLDQRITTIQGLHELHNLVDELYVYHSETLSRTFHPKVFIVENRNKNAVVFVGSSNLTKGGLLSNYETVYQKSYNLQYETDAAEFAVIRQMIQSYKDTTSPCCKRVTPELLRELMEQDYLANEEVAVNFITEVTGKGRPALFGREKFKPPEELVKRGGVEELKTTSFGRANTKNVGFWKKLRPFDVSLTSAPGQIIIPIQFLGLFPAFSTQQTTAVNASQAEAFFNVLFILPSGDGIKVDKVRIIHYFPAPHHPRPNHELRFTFRARDILQLLARDDILEFKQTDNPDIWFEIKLIKNKTREYRRFPKKQRYGVIGS